jgi:flagellar basal-body rod protein FlgG
MNDALFIAATGMQVQQAHLETIANNLVNANTPTFKRAKVSFTEMVAPPEAPLDRAVGADARGTSISEAVRLGSGVGVGKVARQFDSGDLKKTDSAYDVAIQGDGFFEVMMSDGGRAFTRGGTLKVNRDGQLATQAGFPLKPGIAIPENTQALVIAASGQVQARIAGQTSLLDIGQIDLVRFTDPAELIAQGENLYRASEATGEPLPAGGLTTVQQGYLEGSNVKMVDEMVNLMMAQRAYEASVKVIQTSDEMLAAANNLRK